MNNRYGVDISYVEKKINRVMRDLSNYRPDELARELLRLVVVVDEDVLLEPEFNNKSTVAVIESMDNPDLLESDK